ncbi:MAG TPA: hypothetical protein PKK94_27930 [Leptospiraceae bacterium]|nr:hypothetical protein [Leptospiraceae bacterium]
MLGKRKKKIVDGQTMTSEQVQQYLEETRQKIMYETQALMLITSVGMARYIVEDLLNRMQEKKDISQEKYNEYRDFCLSYYHPDKAIDIVSDLNMRETIK